MINIQRITVWVALSAPIVGFSQATSAPTPVANKLQAASLHPWQAAIRAGGAEAYFTNLVDSTKIETPYRATFGLAGGWGLAVITSPTAGKSGHHHLLVNRDLPLDFKQALPFNDQYIHFGKGQMETVLTLEPGNYTLRLLLADDKHLPRFVYSEPIKITVTKKNKAIDPKSMVTKGISILDVVPVAKVGVPFKVGFHASGLNIAHLSQKEKDTGHFRLTILPQGSAKPAEIDFENGQTEVWLTPPAGAYTLKLDLMDNANPGKPLTLSAVAAVTVEPR